MIDVDGDGDLDLVVATDWNAERLFRNDGGTIRRRHRPRPASVFLRATASPIGGVAGDIDNDGIPDLFILRYGTSALYKNDGRDTSRTSRHPPVSGPALPARRCGAGRRRSRRRSRPGRRGTWRTSMRRARARPDDRSRFPTNSRQRRSSSSGTTATAPLPTSRARRRSTSRRTPWRSCRQTSTIIGTSISSSSPTMARRSC